MRLTTAAKFALMFLLSGCAAAVNTLVPRSTYQLSADIAYGAQPRQQLDIYKPANLTAVGSAGAPVVVFFYGGRWENGERANYRFVGEALASRGFVAVIADYRLYPAVKFPAFVEDGALAVRWAHEHAHEYGGDPQKLFVMGHSAGAQIAAMLALDEEYLKKAGGTRQWLSGMIGLAGPYDFLPFTDDDMKDMFGPPERYAQSQPINHVDGKNPPLLLLQGRDDATVLPKNTINLAARIKEKGGTVTTVIYPSMSHVRIVACMASPLRFTGNTLNDVSDFINARVDRQKDRRPQGE